MKKIIALISFLYCCSLGFAGTSGGGGLSSQDFTGSPTTDAVTVATSSTATQASAGAQLIMLGNDDTSTQPIYGIKTTVGGVINKSDATVVDGSTGDESVGTGTQIL